MTTAETPETEPIPVEAEFLALATIHQRIAAILAELPSIGKDAHNSQQNFDYRSHDTVLNALNPLLAKYGVFVVPTVLDRKTGERETSGGKTMYEVNLHVRYRFYGPGGDHVEGSAWGEGTDMGDKSTNKAMTMAFKNVLAQVFAVATAEYDTDATSPEETNRYGVAAPQQPSGERTQRSTRQRGKATFDPGKHQLDGAIALDANFWGNVAGALGTIGPGVDWRETLAPAVLDRFGVAHRDDLKEEPDRIEYAIRLANMIRSVGKTGDITAFPPIADRAPEEVERAVQFAFSTKVDVPIVLIADGIEKIEEAIAEEALQAAAADEVPRVAAEEREHKDPQG